MIGHRPDLRVMELVAARASAGSGSAVPGPEPDLAVTERLAFRQHARPHREYAHEIGRRLHFPGPHPAGQVDEAAALGIHRHARLDSIPYASLHGAVG